MPRSGLIVEVPEAEPVVARWRSRLDPHSPLGVPAHVTVLFPFAAPDDLDETTAATLRHLIASVHAFEFRLTRTAGFDDLVLWLAPEPGESFARLHRLVSDAFPAYPHFGGQFAEFIPHLTVGVSGTAQELAAAERDVQSQLPICATAHAVTLMIERLDDRWERLATFPLERDRPCSSTSKARPSST